jgi:phosphoribosyl 1,2-cyclic phosphate phosphodiesterase
LKVYFLGTGTSQGIPVIGSQHPVCLSLDPRDKRLRVSIWIQWDSLSIVIDCGPDFRQQMLASGCTHIDALFFTHEHADHTAGIDDIRPFNFKQGDLPVYAHLRVIQNLKKRFDYVFETSNKYPGAPGVTCHEISSDTTFKINIKEIIPIEVFHGTLPVLGFRFDNFAYLTDVKTISNKEMNKLKKLDVLVINALRETDHQTHLNLSEALALIAEIQPKRAYLTHISHLMGFHAEVEKKLPKNVYLAFDNLSITV